MSSYGQNAFISINRYITHTVYESILASASSRVVCISSGAVMNSFNFSSDSDALTSDPYSFLKYSEENALLSVADTQVFRIFALSGRFIRDPHIFALGDFLIQALIHRKVVVNSPFPVIRSYVHASDLAKCALSWLFSTEKSVDPINASSHITSLASLADLITKLFRLPPGSTAFP